MAWAGNLVLILAIGGVLLAVDGRHRRRKTNALRGNDTKKIKADQFQIQGVIVNGVSA